MWHDLAEYAAVSLLILSVAVGWVLTLFGLPGNWLMVAAVGFYAWLGPQSGSMQVSRELVVVMAVVAGIGELLEFATGAWAARRAGGSRRAAIYSLLGSFAGAIGGAMLGLPIPVVGSAVGAVLGGAVGALAGAVLAETSQGQSANQSLRVGHAAFWGRLLGTAAKSIVATTMAVAILAALVT
jgi:hypothetical protein